MGLSALSDIGQFPLLYAFVIGPVTTTRPCPPSANVTAIAYVSSQSASSKDAVMAGTMYTSGRGTHMEFPGCSGGALRQENHGSRISPLWPLPDDNVLTINYLENFGHQVHP